MRKKYILLILTGLISLAILSCAGSPPPEETPVPAVPPPAEPAPPEPAPPEPDPDLGPPDQAALSALESAKDRAEAARTRAMDFDSPLYAVQDWESAESLYALAGEEESAGTLGETRESASRYNGAADAFDRAFNMALPFYAQAREDGVIKARDGAIAAGIAGISPERLQTADDTADTAWTQYEAGEYYPASASADLVVDMYNALRIAAGAYRVWEEINAHDFIKYDPGNYDLAEDSAVRAVDAYDALDAGEALSYAGEALERYNLVLAAGWETYAGERRVSASAERQSALDLKANVAVKTEYDAAAGIYNQAEAAFRSGQYPEAVEFYFKSEYMFAVVCGTAAEKRRAAEEAIEAAEDRAAASAETARSAEIILEGGVL
jgi:hypothetical protein